MKLILRQLIIVGLTLVAIGASGVSQADEITLLPNITKKMFMDNWVNREIRPEWPEDEDDLKFRMLRAEIVDGTDEHVIIDECIIIQEETPFDQTTYGVRPVACEGSTKSALVKGKYYTATQVLGNLYELEDVLIEAPKHALAAKHDVTMFVNDRDTANRDLPIDVLIKVQKHQASEGGGSHPGHGNYK
ncbi:MAG: hypothetical protein OEQ74_12095 [Gammaproteobacteria bacterium]|nr:hypothetical protein [Gammaproteobacteria bacterium]